jgi:Na+/proline symporter
MHLALLDWIILAAYFVAITGIGLVVGYRVRRSGEYFLGGRRFGPWLMMGQSFGVGTHAEMPVALAGAVYSIGASAIWFQWKNLFATPFYWIMAPVFRRMRRTTLAEVMEDRYGVWMGLIYTIFALCYFTINTANMLKGAAKVINQATGGGLGVNEIVISMTIIFIVYSFIGGLEASAWTDFFQGFLIIILSFMLIPLGWSAIGGATGLRTSLEAYKFSLATPQGITPWVIAMLTINGLVGVMAQPHQLAAVGTGKDEKTCREGMLYGNYIKRFCTVGWAVVGLVATAMVVQGRFGTNALADPEDAFGFACRRLLFPGGLGLMIAGVLAANMSTCSAFMVDSGALFTQGVYRQWLAQGRPDSQYLWVGRMSGLALTLLGVVYALLLVERVLYSFLLTETMATFMGISFMGGIIWQRANRWGALASLLVSLGTNFSLYAWRHERLDHWNPNVFLSALAAGFSALVVVSLITKAEPREKLRPFFARLHVPAEGEVSLDALEGSDTEEKEVAEAGKQLLLVNLLHPFRGTHGVGFLRAYRVDLKGFAIGWALAIILVLGTSWLFQSWLT